MSRLADAKQALQKLGDLDRSISQELPAMSDDDVVSLGQRLWWLIKRSNKTLEVLKVRLRGLAGSATGSYRVASVDGSHCIVTVPKPAPIIRQDANLIACKQVLGDDFAKCFDEVTSTRPKKDIADQIAELTPDKAAAVLLVLDMSDATPKVAFKD